MITEAQWERRFSAVDKVLLNAKSMWAINYWTQVQRQLLRQYKHESFPK